MPNIQDGQRWPPLQRGVKVSTVKPRPRKMSSNKTIEVIDGVVTDVEMSYTQWVDYIKSRTPRVINENLSFGLDVMNANNAIKKSQWKNFLSDTGMTVRDANNWISIGRLSFRLSKIQPVKDPESILPSSLSTLAKLGRLTEEQLPRAIEAGLITSETTESDVSKWKAQDEQQAIKPKPKPLKKGSQSFVGAPKLISGEQAPCSYCGCIGGH